MSRKASSTCSVVISGGAADDPSECPQMMRNNYRTSGEGVILYRTMTVPVEYVDAQQLWDEKERARCADVEALRSGEKTEAQLKRETEAFAFPPSRARINLGSARSLS
jgi:hypothetical protein